MNTQLLDFPSSTTSDHWDSPVEAALLSSPTGGFETAALPAYETTVDPFTAQPDARVDVLKRPLPRSRRTRKVVRKFHGFLDEIQGPTASVIFVEGESRIPYQPPFKLLKLGGVTERNQPFELHEFVDVRNAEVGYHVLPMARPRDAQTETLDLTDEDRELRDAALNYFRRGSAD